MGLIRKWVRAGILEEDGKVIHPQTGTPQGGIISPVLPKLMKELASKLRGTWNYYGLIDNYRRMKLFMRSRKGACINGSIGAVSAKV